MKRQLDALVSFLGLDVADEQWDQLERFRLWLETEATDAGGIGPHERERLVQRHIGDSLSYAATVTGPPSRIMDVGTGAGLPGIPLAIAFPSVQFTLVDVSGRRIELVERAVSVLRLENVGAQRVDVADLPPGEQTMVVSRAVFPRSEWTDRLLPLLAVGGRAVVSMGREGPKTPPRVEGGAFEIVRLPEQVLDHPVTFLMMTRTARE